MAGSRAGDEHSIAPDEYHQDPEIRYTSEHSDTANGYSIHLYALDTLCGCHTNSFPDGDVRLQTEWQDCYQPDPVCWFHRYFADRYPKVLPRTGNLFFGKAT